MTVSTAAGPPAGLLTAHHVGTKLTTPGTLATGPTGHAAVPVSGARTATDTHPKGCKIRK